MVVPVAGFESLHTDGTNAAHTGEIEASGATEIGQQGTYNKNTNHSE